MAADTSLGEFEHLVLLAILRLGPDARALDLRRVLADRAERQVSRGALYATLERLEKKKLINWKTEASTPARGGIPRRVFIVTGSGKQVLRRTRRALSRLADGVAALESQ